MGKFAAVYDLPAGEQMLICVIMAQGYEPFYQVSTEVRGEQVSLNMPIPEGDAVEALRMTNEQKKEMAVESLNDIPQAHLLNMRKNIVAEILKLKTQSPAGTDAVVQ